MQNYEIRSNRNRNNINVHNTDSGDNNLIEKKNKENKKDKNNIQEKNDEKNENESLLGKKRKNRGGARVIVYQHPPPAEYRGGGGYLHNLADCSHNRDYVKKSVYILYPCRPKVQHVDLVQYVVFLGCKKRAII